MKQTQQRLDRPPNRPQIKIPLVSSKDRLNKIVARFQLEQENKLEHRIFLNHFLREFRAHKKAIKKSDSHSSSQNTIEPQPRQFLELQTRRLSTKAEWLLSELKKNRANGAKEESQYLAFVQLYGDYKEELVKARKLVNTPSPETDPGTVTPEKIEKVPAKIKTKPTVSPTLESTGHVLLDTHIAKKAANELTNIVPLDISDTSTVKSTDSSFTTKPFELTDLFPESLKEKISVALNSTPKAVATKATPKSKLPVIEDSDDKLMDNGKPSQPCNNSANKTNVSTRSNRPKLHPRAPSPERRSTHQPTYSDCWPSQKKDQERAAPQSVETTPEPQSDEEEAPDEELIKTLVKKHVKIYRTYLTTTSKKDKKDLLDRAQESQKILHKLISNQAVQAYVKGWNPWDEKKKNFQLRPRTKQEASSNPIIEWSVQSPFQETPRTQRRPQRSREMEATRSSDDDTQTHASPHELIMFPNLFSNR
ncbi:hypothetical protein H4Q26_005233 [Puccinia striiformis f. sp. tritici PST-130]|nr:hypothetical protein H4Q26_005233 [Puccinia striiformis f. sp. tritici PST-130]